jgi:Flp pilus assembly protein TadB
VHTLRLIFVTLISVAPFLVPVLIACALLNSAKRRRRRRRMSRIPLRSTKADAKRAAKKYAEELAGKKLGWKAARKMLARLERDGRAYGAIGR